MILIIYQLFNNYLKFRQESADQSNMKKLKLLFVMALLVNGAQAQAKKAKKAEAEVETAQSKAIAFKGMGKKASCGDEKGPDAELVSNLDHLVTCFKFDPKTGMFSPNTMTKNFVSVKTSDDGMFTASCRIPIVDKAHPNKKTQIYKYSYTLDDQGRLTYFKGPEYKIGAKSARKDLEAKIKIFKKHKGVKMSSKELAVMFRYGADKCMARAVKEVPMTDRVIASVKKQKAKKKKKSEASKKKSEPKASDWE